MRQRDKGIAIVLGLAIFAFGKHAMASSSPIIDLGRAPPLSLAQVRDVAARAGFTGNALDIATAVAMAESGGYPEALGDKTAGGSYGLWQVNVRFHPEYKDHPEVLYDAAVCAAAAFRISKSGTDWSPWSTFTGKQYLAFMPGGARYPKESPA